MASSTTIPAKMKAVRLTEYNKPYVVTTTSVPTDIGPHDMLVKVAVASYCHTEQVTAAGWYNTPLPCTASHEGAGTVVSVGSDVKDFQPGDRVICGMPLHPCGKCVPCTDPDEGVRQYCPAVKFAGLGTDGFFADYVRIDARTTSHLPDSVSFLNAAPLACAGRTMWRALLLPGLKSGQSVAILGSGGGLGHFGIQFAKIMGLKVIGIDNRDEGLGLSAESGADVIIDGRKGKDAILREVQSVTDGQGADVTINLIEAEEGPALCCAVTKLNGTVVQLSQPPVVKIPYHEFVFRGMKVIGSLIASKGETDNMLEAVVKHGIHSRNEVFQGLDKIGELTHLVFSGKLRGKAVIVVDQEQVDKEKSSQK
ncbi:chaperonin 10-like protein [Coniochaeta sp. 2T2.1]|nr:chaperonin 10-like protein [Coniochaeta sp. 2T2.1]